MLTCLSEGVEALAEYHKSIGGRPEGGKKRKDRKSGLDTESSTPVAAKRRKQEKEWAPPPGSWETDVDHVDTVEQRPNPKTGENEKFGYLVWNNQIKTQHPLSLIFKKCPQRVGVARFCATSTTLTSCRCSHISRNTWCSTRLTKRK
jgi:chromobox protein 1